jgi:hypothetical protein
MVEWNERGQSMDFRDRPSIPPRRRIGPRAKDDPAAREALDWAAGHRGRPPAPPMPSAGKAAGRVVRPLSKAFGPSASELEKRWPEIVGEHLARWTRPERFQSGALVVRAAGPAAALIEAQSAVILQRVAQYAGKAPRRIRIVQGGLSPAERPRPAPPRLKPALAASASPPEPVSDGERLKALLESWGREVTRRER